MAWKAVGLTTVLVGVPMILPWADWIALWAYWAHRSGLAALVACLVLIVLGAVGWLRARLGRPSLLAVGTNRRGETRTGPESQAAIGSAATGAAAREPGSRVSGAMVSGALERETTRELTRTVDELRSSLDRAARFLAARRVDALRPLGREASNEIRSAVATIDRILPHRDAPDMATNGDGCGERPGASPAARGEAESVEDAFVARVRGVIEAGIGDPCFNVEVLARELGMDRSHLYRRIQSVSGGSPSKMIRAIRLERAAILLRRQAGTVSEIAYQVGFKSLAHFSSAFRARYRVPPSLYGKEQASPRLPRKERASVRPRRSLGTC